MLSGTQGSLETWNYLLLLLWKNVSTLEAGDTQGSGGRRQSSLNQNIKWCWNSFWFPVIVFLTWLCTVAGTSTDLWSLPIYRGWSWKMNSILENTCSIAPWQQEVCSWDCEVISYKQLCECDKVHFWNLPSLRVNKPISFPFPSTGR